MYTEHIFGGLSTPSDRHGTFVRNKVHSDIHTSYAGWHTDQDERHDWTEAPPRALSLVIHLDNATNYQNGQFSVAADGETAHVQFQQNDAIIFPADQLWHKVDKVTQGIRRTISFWISHDPKYVTRV